MNYVSLGVNIVINDVDSYNSKGSQPKKFFVTTYTPNFHSRKCTVWVMFCLYVCRCMRECRFSSRNPGDASHRYGDLYDTL